MKIRILLLGCALSMGQLAYSQRSATYVSPDRLFFEGKEMYEDKNYAGCIDKLNAYKQQAGGQQLFHEADFLLVSSAYHQGRADAIDVLKEYLDRYPETRHFDEVCFMVGSVYFEQKDYNRAVYWLDRADLDKLSIAQQEDYAYRKALSCLQTKKKDEAFRLFGLLSQNSSTYRDAATYYSAYLNYEDGEYSRAASLFNKIKDNATFRPEVLYYLLQINFVQKRYTQTYSEGMALLKNYPDNREQNIEVFRLVGSSAYYESDFPEAASWLKQYVDKAASPGRAEWYLLGVSSFYNKQYGDAVNYLKSSNPAQDAEGQNAYLYLGQSYLKMADYTNALPSFAAASRMDFDAQAKEAAMYNYAMLLYKNSVSAFGESLTVLEDFINSYPNSIYADRVNDCLVEMYLTTKSYDAALASINKIKNPGTKILEAKQKIFYHLGTVAFANADFNQAMTRFTQAIGAGNYTAAEKNKAIYWRGETYFRQNNFTAAATDYRAYLHTENQDANLHAMAYYNLGYCAFNNEQYAQAQSSFSQYIALEKDQKQTTLSDAYARLGDCYFFNRQFADATKAYNQAASLQPSMGDYALYQKGFILGLQKDYKGKIATMDNLEKNYPDSRYLTDALYEKGRAYVMLENNTAAITTFENLLSRFPESNTARKAGIQIGLLYFNNNQPQQSAAAYKKVVNNYPGSEEARLAMQDLKSVYLDMNDINGYADFVKSAGGGARFEVSEHDSLLYLSAEKFFVKGETKQAQDGMKKYLQTFPEGAFNINAHYYLAATYYEQGDYVKARPEFQKVLDAGNNSFTEEAVARMAELQYRDEEYEYALFSYERLYNIAGSKVNRDAGALGMMRSAGQLGKYADMVKASDRLLKETSLDPEVATEARYYRAKAYWELAEKTKAQADLQVLSQDDRTVFGAEAHYLLVQSYFDAKDYNKSEGEALKFINSGTTHHYWLARTFIALSDVYVAKDDKVNARVYLESLRNNYKNTNDDIIDQVNERLKKLN